MSFLESIKVLINFSGLSNLIISASKLNTYCSRFKVFNNKKFLDLAINRRLNRWTWSSCLCSREKPVFWSKNGAEIKLIDLKIDDNVSDNSFCKFFQNNFESWWILLHYCLITLMKIRSLVDFQQGIILWAWIRQNAYHFHMVHCFQWQTWLILLVY